MPLLAQLGLAQYAEVLRANDIDGEILSYLSDGDLKELGLSLGHRRKLLAALHGADSAAASPKQADISRPKAAGTPWRVRRADGERRQLTAIFCDLVGSTGLTAALDPEDMRSVLRAYQNVCAGAVARFQGFLAQFMGDGLVAYFGYPRAHENAAEQAVHAALQIVQEIDALRAPGGARLQVRIGIASGLVIVGEVGGDGTPYDHAITGTALNIAARLQQDVASPNTVIIAGETRRLLGGLFDTVDLGPLLLKGIPHPVSAWRVVGERSADSRFDASHEAELTEIVGRDQEIALLIERWQETKSGAGQVILLSGEPGIGKSRICQTLLAHIAGEPHRSIQYQCSPFHINSALYPVAGQLSRIADIAPADPRDVKLAKLTRLLALAGKGAERRVPLIATLFSIEPDEDSPLARLSPQRRKKQTFEALLEHLAALARVQPVLLIVEDAHWIDPTTLEFLTLCIDQLRGSSVMTLITFRPEFRHPWSGQSHVTALTLNRLGRRQCAQMVERVSGGKRLPNEVSQQIVDKTDGVPLFIEELTKTILESGLLREASDRYVLTGALPPMAIPATLHDSLIARLDHLAEVKKVAQIGAAIGREFSYELISAVITPRADELDGALAQLVEAELVHQRGAPPGAIYTFKHALVQDAAYTSMLRSERPVLHARIAAVLAEQFAEMIENQPELLAHHYTEAGLAERAIEQWLKAGRRAADHSANREAVGHLTRGLKLLEQLPRVEMRTRYELLLQTALGMPLIAIKGYAAKETGEAWERARALAEQLGDADHLFTSLYGLWAFNIVGGQCRKAFRIAEQLCTIAQAGQDHAQRLVSDRIMGVSLHSMGDQRRGRAAIEKALAQYDPSRDRPLAFRFGQDQRVAALAFLSLILWLQGFPDQARRVSQQCLAYAREIEHANSLGYALTWGACTVAELCGDVDETDRLTRMLIEHADKNALELWHAYGRVYEGWVSAEHDVAAGLPHFRQAVAALRDVGGSLRLPAHLGLLARTLGRAGHTEEGLTVIEYALTQVERSDVRWCEAELLRIKSELTLALHGTAAFGAVEKLLERALLIANKQGARSWQLRAATDLATLRHSQGRVAEAAQLLHPVYCSFTEGFDTSDLKRAETLLRELNGRMIDGGSAAMSFAIR